MASKRKKTTLTKINPSSLKVKPQGVSQHADDDGIRVTTAVNPIPDPPPFTPADPDDFTADLERLVEEYLGDDIVGDDISRGYYIARVRSLSPILSSTL